MLNVKDNDRQYAVFAGIITLVALALRFYRLDFQSLWLDELYTMKECDPRLSWKETIDMTLEAEHKSPLYFLIEKWLFQTFGYTAFVARSLCALAGGISVYVMFLLGRELLNARTGLIAAAITCVNAFHLHYSQEARGYMTLFLFCVLGLLYFVRTIRSARLSHAALYGLSALLSLHFHPFGALLLVGQGLVAAIYFFSESKARKIAFVKCFGLAYLIVAIGLLPLAESLKHTAAVTSMWIPMPEPGYFVDYVFEFFGNAGFIKKLLFIALLGFITYAFIPTEKTTDRYSRPQFAFVLIVVSLVVAFLLPYLYSVYKVPTLVSRYMIVALPLLIMALAAGFARFNAMYLRWALVLTFVFVSAGRMRPYYTQPYKAQYRDVAQYVKEHSPAAYPVIHDRSPWQLSYYFEQLNISAKIVPVEKNAFAEFVKNGSPEYHAFWLVGIHNDDPKPSEQSIQELNKHYRLVRSKDFFDAWAQLYVARDTLPDHR